MLTVSQSEALNFSSHISLTANAGSGKTLVLSKRFIEIALTPDINLNEIVAITFTDAAAGELFEKISRQFDEEIRNAADDKQRNRLKLLRQQLVTANISTIHSFCNSLLRRYPVEAGIDAGFSPMDETQSSELLSLSIESAIKEIFNNEDALSTLKKTVRVIGSLPGLKKQLARLVRNRKNFLPLYESYYDSGEAKALELYLSKAEEYVEYISGVIENQHLNLIKRLNQYSLENSKKPETARAVDEILNSLDKSKPWNYIYNTNIILEKILTQKGTLRKDYIKEDVFAAEIAELNSVRDLLKSIPPEPDTDNLKQLAVFALNISSLFFRANSHYEKRKRENSFLDFDDILLLTEKLLKNESVIEDLAQRFKYIMIDEYQDTNDVQYNIFLPILDNLKRGNLFVVGDDKQSIYMFRDAELKVFELTKEDITRQSGKVLTLPESFRMAPPVALFNNLVFSELFRNPDKRFNEVEYEEIICAKKDDLYGGVEFILPAPTDEKTKIKSGDGYKILAQQVSGWISEFLFRQDVNTKLSYKNIAVLCRKRNKFPLLEKAFTSAGLPYSIVSGTGFYQHQIILDFYNLFSFLVSRENDHSLAGILRSPFFMISDKELFNVSRSKGFSLWEKLQSYSSINATVRRVYNLLENYLVLASSADPLTIIRLITKDTPYLAVIASRENGAVEYENFRKFISITINFFSTGMRNLYDFTVFLKNAIDNIENEPQAELVEEDDTIKVMTIHQAKGLEFEVVILFDLNDAIQYESIDKGAVIFDKEFGLLAKLPANGQYSGEYTASSAVSAYSFFSKRKQLAEVKRLLYVACTRAKNYLIIPSYTRSPDDNSLLQLITQGLRTDLQNLTDTELPGELTVMIPDENNKTEKRKVSLPIKVITEIGASIAVGETLPTAEVKTGKNNPVDDTQSGEIISATIYSVFKSCPVRYYLTYKLGYGDILEQIGTYAKNARSKFINRENDEPAFPEPKLLGNVIHKIMEGSRPAVDESEMEEILNELFGSDNLSYEKAGAHIKQMISSLTESEVYKRATAGDNSFNEYSISAKIDDYILFGRIDKLTLSGEKAIILDYKTGNLKSDKDKIRFYSDQLRFYAYIVGRMHPGVNEFELILMPVKSPDESIIFKLKRQELNQIESEVGEMIKKIRSENFDKNTSHCKFCGYYINNKCAYP